MSRMMATGVFVFTAGNRGRRSPVDDLELTNLIRGEGDRWEAENMLAIRHSELGHWCGYLAIPEGHPWHGQHIERIECVVHGGLTWAGDCPPDRKPERGLWWIGFDCMHAGDSAPKYPMPFGGEYRTLEYVKGQLMGLAKQAVAAVRHFHVEQHEHTRRF